MSLVSDAGGLLVTAVGVGVVAKAVSNSSKKFKKGWGKGFHGETLKHSENARKTYLKNGKKLPLPKWAKKGKTYSMNGKKSTFLVFK